MTTYDPDYWESLRVNRGDTPHRVDEQRFWDMLEVLPPADWTRGKHFECFRVDEAQTGDLYTWMVRIGKLGENPEFWEMIAPISLREDPRGLVARIETAMRLEKA